MEQLSLYRRVLGERYQQLHPLLQEFHERSNGAAEGIFRIVRPSRFFPWLLGSLLGMPAAAKDVVTILNVQRLESGTEKWIRSFGKFRMTTWQWPCRELLLERSGPVTFGIHLETVDGGMHFITRRVWLIGIPLPFPLAPKVFARVTPIPGGWRAEVRLDFPIVGEMLRYEGEIFPYESRSALTCRPGITRGV